MMDKLLKRKTIITYSANVQFFGTGTQMNKITNGNLCRQIFRTTIISKIIYIYIILLEYFSTSCQRPLTRVHLPSNPNFHRVDKCKLTILTNYKRQRHRSEPNCKLQIIKNESYGSRDGRQKKKNERNQVIFRVRPCETSFKNLVGPDKNPKPDLESQAPRTGTLLMNGLNLIRLLFDLRQICLHIPNIYYRYLPAHYIVTYKVCGASAPQRSFNTTQWRVIVPLTNSSS